MIIAIDAGHGGSSYGTPAGLPDHIEPEMTLEVAHLCAAALALDDRFSPILTRVGDETLSLAERNTIARLAGARLVVSTHFNANPDAELHGQWIYHWAGNDRARKMAKALVSTAPRPLKPGRVIDHIEGQAGGATAVLRAFDAPTVLVECAFLSSPVDRAYLDHHEALSQIASGIIASMPNALTIFGGKQ